MAKTVRVAEYESVAVGDGDNDLTKDQFEALKDFIVSNSERKDSPIDLMSFSARKGERGEVIKAKNYVGVIDLNDGTQIEILPKIYGKTVTNDKDKDYEVSKGVLLNMLGTLMDASGKSIQSSNMGTARLPLYEIFIRMFLDEAFEIYKRGFKRGYSTVSGNEAFLRGKLVISQQVRQNLFHSEIFFVEYDEFDENHAENRLLKSTLVFLERRSRDSQNRQNIRFLLNELCKVECSIDLAGDFKKASIAEKNNEYYKRALSWCEVFLRGESFTPFVGSEYATAVLFPMDKLYESYVAKRLAQLLPREYTVSAQSPKYHLFNNPNRFLLKPDIVISKDLKTAGNLKPEHVSVILDTKWKLLDPDKDDYGIAQSDMYQMYAYFREYQAHKENVKTVITLYPWTCRLRDDQMDSLSFQNNTDPSMPVAVKAEFIDLTYRFESVDEKYCFAYIVNEIEELIG